MRRTLGWLGVWVLVACGRVSNDGPSAPSGAGSNGVAGSATTAGSAGATAAGGMGAAGGVLGESGAANDADSAGDGGDSGSDGNDLGPRPYRALHISGGALHSCAILEDHRLKCWGMNFSGQLGLGTVDDHGLTGMGDALPFVDLGTGRTAKAVAGGRYSTCAILDDDSAKCWGWSLLQGAGDIAPNRNFVGDEPGEMGDALPTVDLGPGHHATFLAVGINLGCIAREDGAVKCGWSPSGEFLIPPVAGASLLGLYGGNGVLSLHSDGLVRVLRPNGGSEALTYPTDVVAVGSADHCQVYWSKDRVLHIPSLTNKKISVSQVSSLAASQACPACAVTGDRRVHCWNGFAPDVPLADDGSLVIPLPRDAVELAGDSYEHICALLTDGSVWCWDWMTDAAPAAAGGTPSKPKQIDLGTWQPH